MLLPKHLPASLLNLQKAPLYLVSQQIRLGIRDAHNQDVRVVKEKIASIYGLEDCPKDKAQRGFYYEPCARLLRPIGVEVDSDEWYVVPFYEFIILTLYRKELHAGTALPATDEWAAYMYAGKNGPMDRETISDGFLLDETLVQVYPVLPIVRLLTAL